MFRRSRDRTRRPVRKKSARPTGRAVLRLWCSRSRPTRTWASWPIFRVYSGMLESGSYVLNSTKGERERIGRLLRMHANHREEIESVAAGDICAIIGLKSILHGRHALRSGAPDHPRIDHLPGAGDLGLGRAEDQGRPGQDGRGAGRWRKKTRPSGFGRTRRPARRSSRGWANSTSKSSSTA